MNGIDQENIRIKTRKQLLIIGVVGILLLVADWITAGGSPQIHIIESEGKLYMLRPQEGEEVGHLALQARIEGEGESFEQKINVALDPYSENHEEDPEEQTSAMTERERLEYEMRSVVSSFNQDSSLKKVLLPQKLSQGETIRWQVRKDGNTILILVMTLLIMAVVYKNRFSVIKRQQQLQQNSVMRQLPEFVNRMVLLLNAGLVLNSAFEKSIREGMEFKRSDEDYFYRNMEEIYGAAKTANKPLHKGFREFAKESGNKELMRISNIINDNISKGVALTEKLQQESELLWISRKKGCEERGRLAETKLTLPLMIFLMVLIVITVAPALLEL